MESEKQKDIIKDTDQKKRIKKSLLLDTTWLYLENPKGTWKYIELISEFSKSSSIKNHIRNNCITIDANNEMPKENRNHP